MRPLHLLDQLDQQRLWNLLNLSRQLHRWHLSYLLRPSDLRVQLDL